MLGDGWERVKMVKEDLTAREQFQLKDTLDVFQTKIHASVSHWALVLTQASFPALCSMFPPWGSSFKTTASVFLLTSPAWISLGAPDLHSHWLSPRAREGLGGIPASHTQDHTDCASLPMPLHLLPAQSLILFLGSLSQCQNRFSPRPDLKHPP